MASFSSSSDVTRVNFFQLRIAVFESLRETNEVKTTTINNLRRDCETRLNLSKHSLDGSAFKKILALNYTEYLRVSEASIRHNSNTSENEVPIAEKEQIVADFLLQIYIDYVSSNRSSCTEMGFNSLESPEHPLWAGILRLVPHLCLNEIQTIIKDQLLEGKNCKRGN